MFSFIKQNNLPFVLLIMQIGKSFFYPTSIYDGVAFVAISVLFGFKLYLDHIKKPDFSQEIIDKFEEYKTYTENRLKEVDELSKKRMDEANGKISALNVAIQPKARKPGENPYAW